MNEVKYYKKGRINLSEAAEIRIWMQHYLVENGFKSSYSLEDFDSDINLEKSS